MESESVPANAFETRDVTADERALLRHCLEIHSDETRKYLPQVEKAKVVGLCPCGVCPSIDLAVEGASLEKYGHGVLAEFCAAFEPDIIAGVIIWENSGWLTGLEVYSMNGNMPLRLARPEETDPIGPPIWTRE